MGHYTIACNSNALIDVKSSSLTLRINNEEVQFNILCSMKFANDLNSCNIIGLVDEYVEFTFHSCYSNASLKNCLVHLNSRK